MYFIIHKQKHSSIAQVVKLSIVIFDACLKALKYSMHT